MQQNTWRHVLALGIIGAVLACGSGAATAEPDAAGKPSPRPTVLIVAPHPDDESLGCAGVMLRASRLGMRVRVVFLTNGDGYPKAAALLQNKEVKALTAEDYLALGRARQQQ